MKADFSKIIRDSIHITKKYKRLWVLGVVVAALGGGANFSSGLNLNNSFSNTSSYPTPQKPNSSDEQPLWLDFKESNVHESNLLTGAFPQVLSATTFDPINLLNSIPLTFYVGSVLFIIISMLIGGAIYFYGSAWAQSGLIYGIAKASENEAATLYQMSDIGKQKAKEVIKLKLFPAIIFSGVTLMWILLLVIIGLAIGGGPGKVIITVLGFIMVTAIILASIVLGVSTVLGIIAINLEALTWKAGFAKGYRVFKRFFVDVVVMGIISCFSGCVFSMIFIPGIVLLIGVTAASVAGVAALPPFIVVAAPVIFLTLLAFILFAGLVSALAAVFTQSTWVLLYKQLTEDTDGHN